MPGGAGPGLRVLGMAVPAAPGAGGVAVPVPGMPVPVVPVVPVPVVPVVLVPVPVPVSVVPGDAGADARRCRCRCPAGLVSLRSKAPPLGRAEELFVGIKGGDGSGRGDPQGGYFNFFLLLLLYSHFFGGCFRKFLGGGREEAGRAGGGAGAAGLTPAALQPRRALPAPGSPWGCEPRAGFSGVHRPQTRPGCSPSPCQTPPGRPAVPSASPQHEHLGVPSLGGSDGAPRPCRTAGILLSKCLHAYNARFLSPCRLPHLSPTTGQGAAVITCDPLVTGDLFHQPSYSFFFS